MNSLPHVLACSAGHPLLLVFGLFDWFVTVGLGDGPVVLTSTALLFAFIGLSVRSARMMKAAGIVAAFAAALAWPIANPFASSFATLRGLSITAVGVAMSVVSFWFTKNAASRLAPPESRRPRWLCALSMVLIVGATMSWWYRPRIDDRLVGKWAYTPSGEMSATVLYDLRADGSAAWCVRYAGKKDFHQFHTLRWTLRESQVMVRPRLFSDNDAMYFSIDHSDGDLRLRNTDDADAVFSRFSDDPSEETPSGVAVVSS